MNHSENSWKGKSTIEELKQHFDHNVERFSHLDTGQSTVIDSVWSMQLISDTLQAVVPEAQNLLDLGCGAGNFTLKILQTHPHLNCTLIDLSQGMLDRAVTRVTPATCGTVESQCTDFMQMQLPASHFDCVVAGAALHHLREEAQWEQVFASVYECLRPGGIFLISDLVTENHPALQALMLRYYRDYLVEKFGAELQRIRFDSIEHEDSPRSVGFQLHLLEQVGFRTTDLLHKTRCFAVMCGIK